MAKFKRIAKSLPVVMLISDARLGDAGVLHYALKPVTRAQLLRIVCEAIEVQEILDSPPAVSVDRTTSEPVKPAQILVAEDSHDTRVLAQVYLKASPYHVTFEEDGKAAMDRFAASDFDLVLWTCRCP